MLPVTQLLGQGRSCLSGRGGWCRLLPAALYAAHAATSFGRRWKAIAARQERVPPCLSDLSSHPASPRTRSAGRREPLGGDRAEPHQGAGEVAGRAPGGLSRPVQVPGCADLLRHREVHHPLHFDSHQKRSAIDAGLDSPPLSATPSPLSGVSDLPPNRANKKRNLSQLPLLEVPRLLNNLLRLHRITCSGRTDAACTREQRGRRHLQLLRPERLFRFSDKEVSQFPMPYVMRKKGSNMSAHEVMEFVAKKINPLQTFQFYWMNISIRTAPASIVEVWRVLISFLQTYPSFLSR